MLRLETGMGGTLPYLMGLTEFELYQWRWMCVWGVG